MFMNVLDLNALTWTTLAYPVRESDEQTQPKC